MSTMRLILSEFHGVVLSVLLVFGCSSTGGGASLGGGSLGGPCSADANCTSGLICAQGSDLKGMCTAACKATSECQVKFGDASSCWDGYCARQCDTTADCAVGHCAVLAGGHDFCSSGPAPMSETCSKDSDCKTGLVCGTEGKLVGLCTRSCTVDSDCRMYSAGAACVLSLGVCTRGCYEDDECPEDGVCILYTAWDGYCSL